MNQQLQDVLRLAELDLQAPLRTWRSRIEAACAECLDPEDSGIVLGHLIRATIAPSEARERRRWARASGRLLTCVWLGRDGRSAVARGALLALADRADAQQSSEV